MQTQSPQSQATPEPTSVDSPDNGRVQLQDDGSRQNRTTYVINDDGEDPLDLSPPKKKPEEDVTVQEEKQTQDVTEEEKPPEEKPKYDEQFNTTLETVLEERTGVGLDGIVEAVTTLLSWYNDIMSLEQNNGQQVTPQPAPKAPPTFARSQGRNPSPAANAYDYRLSEIRSMAPEDYSKHAQKITNAFLQKRVLMDE